MVKIKLRGLGIRRKLVVFKYTLQRGYAWAQIPTLAMIGAGVLKPYFPNWTIWTLGAMAMFVYLIIGIIDRAAGLLHEETNYGTEMSPLLMKGLRGELKKDKLEVKKEDDNKKADNGGTSFDHPPIDTTSGF